MLSMTGYFFDGSKFVGRKITPQMSVLPSRPFATNDSGALHPAFASCADISALQLHDPLAVGGLPQFHDGRQVHARVGVDIVLHVGRKAHRMIGVRLGQGRQPGAVEVDSVVVDEVGILARVHAARAEPDLARLLVGLDDAADDPVALRDLRGAAGRAVIEIEVVPAVALRHPDDLLPVLDIVAVLLARIAEERLRLLGDDRSGFAAGGVDFNDAIHLVAALVVLERHRRAVLAPNERRHVIRVGEQRPVDDVLPPGFDLEDHRLLDVEHIARLGVHERASALAAAGLPATTAT